MCMCVCVMMGLRDDQLSSSRCTATGMGEDAQNLRATGMDTYSKLRKMSHLSRRFLAATPNYKTAGLTVV